MCQKAFSRESWSWSSSFSFPIVSKKAASSSFREKFCGNFYDLGKFLGAHQGGLSTALRRVQGGQSITSPLLWEMRASNFQAIKHHNNHQKPKPNEKSNDNNNKTTPTTTKLAIPGFQQAKTEGNHNKKITRQHNQQTSTRVPKQQNTHIKL